MYKIYSQLSFSTHYDQHLKIVLEHESLFNRPSSREVDEELRLNSN